LQKRKNESESKLPYSHSPNATLFQEAMAGTIPYQFLQRFFCGKSAVNLPNKARLFSFFLRGRSIKGRGGVDKIEEKEGQRKIP
jgi:hypothetical protein